MTAEKAKLFQNPMLTNVTNSVDALPCHFGQRKKSIGSLDAVQLLLRAKQNICFSKNGF